MDAHDPAIDAALARIREGGIRGQARQERQAGLGDATPQSPTRLDASYWLQLSRMAQMAGEVAIAQDYMLRAMEAPPPCARIAPLQYRVGDGPPISLLPGQD
jgi:hypothetical protein